MAFTNAQGQQISYDCADLINELKEDIAEFGGDLIVEVVAEQRDGVTIYKDYWSADDNDGALPTPAVNENEKLVKMTATALLELYETENSIL